jgi:putative lipase involved disintegration of autophagic bodies
MPNNRLNHQIKQELLRQSAAYFDLTVDIFQMTSLMTFVSSIVGTIGVALMFTGHVSEGTLASVSGLLFGSRSLALTEQVSERLEEANRLLSEVLDHS